jgi:hypothetical protein
MDEVDKLIEAKAGKLIEVNQENAPSDKLYTKLLSKILKILFN